MEKLQHNIEVAAGAMIYSLQKLLIKIESIREGFFIPLQHGEALTKIEKYSHELIEALSTSKHEIISSINGTLFENYLNVEFARRRAYIHFANLKRLKKVIWDLLKDLYKQIKDLSSSSAVQKAVAHLEHKNHLALEETPQRKRTNSERRQLSIIQEESKTARHTLSEGEKAPLEDLDSPNISRSENEGTIESPTIKNVSFDTISSFSPGKAKPSLFGTGGITSAFLTGVDAMNSAIRPSISALGTSFTTMGTKVNEAVGASITAINTSFNTSVTAIGTSINTFGTSMNNIGSSVTHAVENSINVIHTSIQSIRPTLHTLSGDTIELKKEEEKTFEDSEIEEKESISYLKGGNISLALGVNEVIHDLK